MEVLSDLVKGAISAFADGGGSAAVLQTIGNAAGQTATTFDIAHTFATRDVEVAVYRNATPWDKVYVQTERPTTGTVRLVYDSPPGPASFRVLVWKPGSGGAGGGADPGDLAALEARVLQREKVDPTDIIPLPIDGGVLTDNLFTHNAQDEVAHALTGQNTLVDAGVSLAASTLQAYFGLPTEDTTVRQHYPFMFLEASATQPTVTQYRIIPLSHISLSLFTSPINLNLFEIADFDARAITAFKYTGDRPLHTIIDGHMNFLLRVGDVGPTTANTRIRTTIYLRATPKPVFDDEADQTLGTSLGSADLPTFQLNTAELEDGNDNTDPVTVGAGAWLKKSIAVKRVVNFQPGHTYRLLLQTSVVSGSYTPVEWGLRIESGGFSCALDGSQVIKRAVKNIMVTGV